MIGLGLNYVSSGTPTAGIYGSWQGENYNRTITSVNGSSLNLNTGLKELFTETAMNPPPSLIRLPAPEPGLT